jgi:hypothetical protein
LELSILDFGLPILDFGNPPAGRSLAMRFPWLGLAGAADFISLDFS